MAQGGARCQGGTRRRRTWGWGLPVPALNSTKSALPGPPMTTPGALCAHILVDPVPYPVCYPAATRSGVRDLKIMATSSSNLWRELQDVLNRRSAHPYPHLPTPEGCRKRASVALIIRIRPAFTPATAESDGPIPPVASLDDFFSQPWVQNGDPEILFIKRAGRPGDRWSGHVALPGGKRDPDDESDVAAAIRETREEVGLDLSNDHCLHVGNLPERVVGV